MARLRFDCFELDTADGELRRGRGLVKLQPQPMRVLALLASRAGRLVSREEIQKEIWTDDTFVDFDQGLNYCIRQIRLALSDSAETPRFIETVPRRGYRFLAGIEEAAAAPAPGRRVMLAVLPFENLSGDQEQEYFSDGLTDEMIAQLARMNSQRLGVIARTSAMKYKHTDTGVDVIARQLGVSYVLEGSVRRRANRVRVAIASSPSIRRRRSATDRGRTACYWRVCMSQSGLKCRMGYRNGLSSSASASNFWMNQPSLRRR